MSGRAVQRYAVIVDPVSTGQEYPAAFRAAGVEPVAVVSMDPFPACYQVAWHPENFGHVHAFDGDLAGLAELLRGYHPLCVIAGSEAGVELADALVELVVPGTGNIPELAYARKDKRGMAEAVAAAGIPHLRQLCTPDPGEVARWLRDTGLGERPVVFKPPRSAGADNVHIVPAGADWRPYFDQIYDRVNEVGVYNDAVLVQEYAEGTEYLVDSYSVDGEHRLVDVCRYTKLQLGDRIGIYDLVDFLPPDDQDIAVVWPYVRRVLDAVGVRNGSGHTEVVVTADGPRLLEIGARQAGGGHQMITELATGTNQILRTVRHRVHGVAGEDYHLEQHVCSVVISAPVAGIWRNADLFDGVESLATFHAKSFRFGTGDLVPAAGSLATFLGWVVLVSPDRAALEADYRSLKELERQIAVDATAQPALAEN